MKNIIVIVFLFGIIYPLSATEQEPDILIYKDQTFYIRDLPPLYLGNFLPFEESVKIRKDAGYYPSACVRGYIATWMVEGDSLFLTKLENWSGEVLPLENYFPGKVTPQGVFAGWFNYTIKAGTHDIMLSMSSGKYKDSIRFFGIFKQGILEKDLLTPKK